MPDCPIPIGACFRLGNTELQQDFNSFLADIRRDGTYQKNIRPLAKCRRPFGNGHTSAAWHRAHYCAWPTYPAMPPFNFISSGKPSGLEIDILTEWANRRNWQLEFLVMDFASQIPAVQTGKADMAMGAISITEERQKQVLFSDGYFDSHILFLTRKGEAGILTNPSQSLHPRRRRKGKWPWVVPILIIGGGGAWLHSSKAASAILHQTSDPSISGESSLISISHLKKSYGTLDVLRDINLDVHKGEVISIIGPSGTGKSTFLRCLNLLEQPTKRQHPHRRAGHPGPQCRRAPAAPPDGHGVPVVQPVQWHVGARQHLSGPHAAAWQEP